MSGYIIEEPEECPVYYCSDSKEEIIEYWRLYSNIQKKRLNKVLRQMLDTWDSVYITFNFIRNNTDISIEASNDLMKKIFKMFMIEHKHKTEYYNEEKIKLRKNKNYITKKINKLKNTKNKI